VCGAGLWLKPVHVSVCTAGARVIMEGDVGDKFYIIKEGEAQVIQGDREVNRLFRSDFFGEQALLQDEPRCVARGQDHGGRALGEALRGRGHWVAHSRPTGSAVAWRRGGKAGGRNKWPLV
jgi:hypothetical protein